MADGPGAISLFMVYVGGRAGNANIELHDVRFVAGESIEDTYPALRQQWFGEPHSLHLDSYMTVRNVDGYRVLLSEKPDTQKEKLFFVNLGGYDPAEIAELHAFGLFVATSSGAAKTRAKECLLAGSHSRHKDDLYNVDDCLSVERVNRYFIRLAKGGEAQPQKPDWFGYRPIGQD